mgnify:CR=1 FL=1
MTASFLLALILVGWFAGGIARACWLDSHIPFSGDI